MSVILTATKKSVQAKSKSKPKSKHQTHHAAAASQQGSFDPTPPMSTERTTVWHWMLDGVATTVMFEKDKGDVWYNGQNLETRRPFGGIDQQVVEFTLEVKPHKLHIAKIRRITKGSTYKDTEYQLYVDTIAILEHSNRQPYAPVSYDQASDDFPNLLDAPPAYDYMDPINQASPFDKKTK